MMYFFRSLSSPIFLHRFVICIIFLSFSQLTWSVSLLSCVDFLSPLLLHLVPALHFCIHVFLPLLFYFQDFYIHQSFTFSCSLRSFPPSFHWMLRFAFKELFLFFTWILIFFLLHVPFLFLHSSFSNLLFFYFAVAARVRAQYPDGIIWNVEG